MKAIRTMNEYPAGSLMNPAFRYQNSSNTDVARTFARIRREQAQAAKAASAKQMALALFAKRTGAKA